jgi:hypothetical protein
MTAWDNRLRTEIRDFPLPETRMPLETRYD